MNRNNIAMLLLLVLALFLPGCSDNKKEAANQSPDNISAGTGAIGKDGGTQSFDYGKLKLSVTVLKDKIYFVLTSQFPGWAAIGIGSNGMNGAEMFIGYMDKDGKVFFSEQAGSGHSHAEVPADKRIAESYAVTKQGGVVTLGVQCPLAKVLPDGDKEIPLIIAASDTASFAAFHSMKRQLTVKLE